MPEISSDIIGQIAERITNPSERRAVEDIVIRALMENETDLGDAIQKVLKSLDNLNQSVGKNSNLLTKVTE